MRLLLLCAIFYSIQCNGQQLEEYRWKNRIVLLFADADSKKISENQKLLKASNEGLSERDVLVFIGTDDLRKNFGIDAAFEGIALIGKDGTLKFSGEFPVLPKTLFEIIDAMPMRRAEMRSKN